MADTLKSVMEELKAIQREMDELGRQMERYRQKPAGRDAQEQPDKSPTPAPQPVTVQAGPSSSPSSPAPEPPVSVQPPPPTAASATQAPQRSALPPLQLLPDTSLAQKPTPPVPPIPPKAPERPAASPAVLKVARKPEVQASPASREAPPKLRSNQPVYDLQRLLNATGFDAGKEDGKRGGNTERAIERFKEKYNEKIESGEYPYGRWSKLEKDTPLDGILSAARNELVERTLWRASQYEKGKGDSKTEIQKIQRNLKLMDFYLGPVDGKRSAELSKAIDDFQHNHYRDLVSLDPFGKGKLTGRGYVDGNEQNHILKRDKKGRAEQRYLRQSEFSDFDMPVEALRPYANDDGWVVWKKPEDWGLNKNGASFVVGQMGAYNVKTGQHYDFGDGRTSIPYMAGGAGGVYNKSNEWQKDAATPGDVQLDFLPREPALTAAEKVQGFDPGHRFGFFALLTNGLQPHRDAIGIHPDVGSVGSHGCPNAQKKNPETGKHDAADVEKMFRKLKPGHTVTLDADINLHQGHKVEKEREGDAPAKPQRRSDLPPHVKEAADKVAEADTGVRGGQEASEVQSQQVAQVQEQKSQKQKDAGRTA